MARVSGKVAAPILGLMLVGDTGGSVNPFNGEGIPYAIESGKYAAEAVIQGLARPAGPHS